MKEYEMFIELLMKALFRIFRKYDILRRNFGTSKGFRLGTLQREAYQNGGGTGIPPSLTES